MPHQCQAAIITCEDFRLHQRKDGRNYLANFTSRLALDCDLITRAGGVQDLVRPKEAGFTDSVRRDVEVSGKLHQAKIIILINHQDCGAYSSFNFSSTEEEIKQHQSDLKQAAKILNQRFPGKEIKLYFAQLRLGSTDVFEIKEIY